MLASRDDIVFGSDAVAPGVDAPDISIANWVSALGVLYQGQHATERKTTRSSSEEALGWKSLHSAACLELFSYR